MRAWAWLAVVCVSCAAQEGRVPGVSATEPPAEDATLMKQLEEINARTAKITDLSAEFEQKKFTPLLKSPMVSTGRVKVKGAVIRWDTIKPEPSVMRIDERELRIYYPAQTVVEVYPIGEDMRRLSSSPLPRLENLRRQFSIARFDAKELDAGAEPAKVVGVAMTPTVAEIKEHVKLVRVVIDIAAAYATHMEITDSDGERTVVVFTKLRANSGLTEKDVALETPTGVRVTRPLAGGTGDGR